MASPLTAILDHLLTEIFLRLPEPADLVRASAACVPFRQLATEGSFLRRFRRLHAPPFLGFLNYDRFHPALPPHPSAPAARALAVAADFSFSFLPSRCRWAVQDTRDGRVLLHRLYKHEEQAPVFQELVVCDPLHRLYVLLPPVPDDLADSVNHPIPMAPRLRRIPFLVPLCEEETAAAAATEEKAFRVIWMAYSKTKLDALVFSSSTGQWQATESKDWSALVHGMADKTVMSRTNPLFLSSHYAYGCFYWDWVMIGRKKLLVLDTRRMEFSIADLPPGEWSVEGIAIVEAGEGKLGMFGFHGEFASHLSYTIARNKGKSPVQWQMEKTISLDSGYKYHIRDATERYLLLTKTEASSPEHPLFEYFSINVKTLQLQRVCAKQSRRMYGWTHIYTNFPPSLASRTI
ncbi:hypothetical protein ZWY2020_000492 [Hordeum vulgare]|nr:hypothetical protein ZWY2020_000492 [Hordeum vulgare]